MLRGFAEKLVMDTTATIRSRSTACSRVSLSTAGSSWISYGKEIAHLSYKRLDVPPDEKGWIVVSIGREPAATFDTGLGSFRSTASRPGWLQRFDQLEGVCAIPSGRST